MRKYGRLAGLFVILFGVMALTSSLLKPRIQALHGSDIVGLVGAGMCLGVGFVCLLGRLKIRDE
jgi:hypothetical protein